ncbi:hypothetical protein PSTG_03628 [Puccinia striiformis f. sp. tritici PST-78]|uniref:Secreted protein n=1 Tax=Puccinia striiformis f. sp. tritici PST-78 TaxID=1165861 RepID=A0A0L0VVM4_9BASI|nr:hypothetical protein PSTG_03628 [Puccinia striiformis f. sp. tritici PST-78]
MSHVSGVRTLLLLNCRMEAMCLQVRLTNARTNHNGQTQVTPNPRLHPSSLPFARSISPRLTHWMRSVPTAVAIRVVQFLFSVFISNSSAL